MSTSSKTDRSSFLSVRTKLIGFGLFAGLSLFAIITYTVNTLDQQKADSTIINIAGRQRMLSQKYTKEVFDELNWGEAGNSEASDKTRELFQVSLQALMNGGATFSDLGMKEALELSATEIPEALEVLGEVENHWSALQQAVASLRETEPGSAEWDDRLGSVRELNVLTLKTMNKGVGILASDSSNKIASMTSTEWSLFGVVIAIGSLFSFLLIRSITRPLAELSKKIAGVAGGVLDQEPMVVRSADEIGKLALLSNGMLENLKDIGQKVNQVAEGHFDVRFEAQSETDQFAAALNDMIQALETAGVERAEAERAQSAENAEAERLRVAEDAEAERLRVAEDAEAERLRAAEKAEAELLHATEKAEAERLHEEEKRAQEQAEAQRELARRDDQGAAEEQERASRERTEADTLKRSVDEILESVKIAATGDLTHVINCDASGAVGDIARGLSSFLAKVREDFIAITSTTSQLSTASTSLREVSGTMEGAAAESAENAKKVSAESEEVSSNIQTVASAAEEMSACIKEVAQRTSEASILTSGAVTTASNADEIMRALGKNSEQIGRMVSIISGIARQTNLLALNANIEAARAGDAGKGFSVVANEVKELAHETEKATEEIARTVGLIQADSQGAIESIGEINKVIDSINQLQGVVASAVEEQSATTDEIVRSVSNAARGSSEIAERNRELSQASDQTRHGAQNALNSADEVSRAGVALTDMVSRYKC